MDINTKQVYSKSALHAAVGNNDIKSVQQQLVNGTNVNILDEDGRTALCIAAEKDFLAIAEVLLMHGADPNLTNSRRSALRVAVLGKSVSFTKLLLKYGANPNLKSLGDSNDTALHAAMVFCCSDLVKILLAHNADPNLTNASGDSALHEVFYYNSKENLVALTLLLDYLACPDIRNEEGDSALHLAVTSNNVTMVKKLLACGADPNSTNNYGNSILHTVLSYSFPDARDISLSIVKALLEAGANVASTDKLGRTPLHLNPSQDVALCLLDKGAAVDVQDNCGQTPLHCSLFDHYYHGDTIEPLLFSGANLDIPDQAGKTCIQVFGETCNHEMFYNNHIVILKFAMLNMKRKVTRRFDLNTLIQRLAFHHCIELLYELKLMYDELEKVKCTNIEDICLYNVLKLNTKDLSYLHNEAFRTAIEGDDFKKEFPKFYLLTRMCVREAEMLKPLVEELSQSFALKLTTELCLNVPQEVSRLIIIELESEDIVNLKIALSC